MHSTPRRPLIVAGALVSLALLAAGCGDDGDASGGTEATAAETAATTASETSDTTSAGGAPADGVTAEGISEERCAANQDAGKITYLSGFDFASTSSIIDVVVADAKGYYEDMCLDVELKPSFSTANYPLVAADQAQFASGGNFTEIVKNSTGGAELVALVNYGKTAIEGLVVPEGGATSLEGLEGKTIGVKGDIPPSIVAMLNAAGLERGTDYKEVLLDGFDPRAHLATGIDALPVYRNNEPGQLDAAGIAYEMFTPTEQGIPGSFGMLFTSKQFLEEHPSAAQDFVRATLRGMADAIAEPEQAVDLSMQRIEAAGNQAFLTKEGETFRWTSELEIIQGANPQGEPIGVILPERLQSEVDFYDEAGVFADGKPSIEGRYAADVAREVYGDDGTVIWPAG